MHPYHIHLHVKILRMFSVQKKVSRRSAGGGGPPHILVGHIVMK